MTLPCYDVPTLLAFATDLFRRRQALLLQDLVAMR